MPTPRNPILVDVNTSFRNWQIETNAITNIINYFVRSSDGAWVVDSAEISNSAISGGTVTNVFGTNSTYSGVTVQESSWYNGTMDSPVINSPTVSGTWDFNTATMSIKSGNDTDRLNKGYGTPVEMFYNFTDNLLYIFDGTVLGGRPFHPDVTSATRADTITLEDALNRYDANTVESALMEIAGSGRLTTETVASNADNIATKAEESRLVTAGSGLSGGGTLESDITLEHTDTSTVTDVTDSGVSGFAVTGLSFDDFGHTLSTNVTDFSTLFLEVTNNLSDLNDVPTARTNLELGTASTEDITTSATDTTAGALTKVGDFGWGSLSPPLIGDLDDSTLAAGSYYYQVTDGSTGTDPGSSIGVVLVLRYDSSNLMQIFQSVSTEEIYHRYYTGSAWSSWREFYHSGNYPSDTGWTTVASLDNGWTGTVRYIKRAGMVTVLLEELDGSSRTASIVFSLEADYEPFTLIRGTCAGTSGSPNTIGILSVTTVGGIQITGDAASDTSIYGSVTYPVIP